MKVYNIFGEKQSTLALRHQTLKNSLSHHGYTVLKSGSVFLASNGSQTLRILATGRTLSHVRYFETPQIGISFTRVCRFLENCGVSNASHALMMRDSSQLDDLAQHSGERLCLSFMVRKHDRSDIELMVVPLDMFLWYADRNTAFTFGYETNDLFFNYQAQAKNHVPEWDMILHDHYRSTSS